MKPRQGFSLIELLVVVAILGILSAMYMGVFGKALRAAKNTASNESMHQFAIGYLADGGFNDGEITREKARYLFRHRVNTGKEKVLRTELLCVVKSDAAFKAYWHTLINPENTEELEFGAKDALLAQDAGGTEYVLHRRDKVRDRDVYPIQWDFLSTNMAEMSSGSLRIGVLYNDGRLATKRYGEDFPATRTVAELSHEFVRLRRVKQ